MKKTKKTFSSSTYPLSDIKNCNSCGHQLSINNTTCYNCGFKKDNPALHEELLNRKYINYVRNHNK